MREPQVKSPLVVGVDGQRYSSDMDASLDDLVDGCFSGGSGPRTLAYLESLTTRRVLGPQASDQELRHLEGARWLVGVIRGRIQSNKARNDATSRGTVRREPDE